MKFCKKCNTEVTTAKWQYSKEMCKNCATKEYYSILKNKQKRKRYEKSKSYNQSVLKYRNSKKGKIAIRRYITSEKGKIYKKRKDLKYDEKRRKVIHLFSVEEWIELRNKTNGFCPKCKEYVGINCLQLDHIFPVSKAGSCKNDVLIPSLLFCKYSPKKKADILLNPSRENQRWY